MRIKQKEKDVQRAVLDWLSYQKIFHFRNNSGVMFKEYKGKTQMVRFGSVGSPDIICVINGQFIGFEIKGTTGVVSDAQQLFKENLEHAGGVYLVIRDLQEVIDYFKSKEKERLYFDTLK